MKICAISPNPAHLQSAAAVAQARGHSFVPVHGGRSRLREVVEAEAPDLVIVDGMCRDAAELEPVEHVTSRHPRTAVMLLCSAQAPDFLIAAMRAGVREVLDSPPSDAALAAAIDRIDAKLGGGRKAGQVVAVMGAKGGSGASFIAANLAWQLADERSVLLVDLNLQFGDALGFMQDAPAPNHVTDVLRDVSRLDASLLQAATVKVSPRLGVLAAPEDLAQAGQVRPSQLEALLSVAASQHDFVVLDLPRALDPLGLKALDAAHRILVVLQSSLPDVRHASRLVAAFQALGYPQDKTELVLNRLDRHAQIGTDDLQRTLGPLKVHTVPNAYREVRSAIDQGEPMAKVARSSAVLRQLSQIAQTFQPRREADRGLLGRLFRTA